MRHESKVSSVGLMNEAMIKIDADVSDWRDAIKVAGDLLVQSGHIEDAYISAMIESALENGPYFVLVPGVALPHASSSRGVLREGVSVVTLAHPVTFMDSPNNPVELVICLAAQDGPEHLELLTKVSQLLLSPDDLQAVMKAKSASDILAVFNP